MFLEEQSNRWVSESVQGYDPVTNTFSPLAFPVRVSITDQFLSNFNRPLRRRMLYYPLGSPLPESLTIKLDSTGDVYLIGQAREDSYSTGAYNEMAVGHLVTDEGVGSSSGLATQHRYTTDGPVDDPGWATEKQIGQTYMDLEFRSSLNEADLTETRTESFVAFFPRTLEAVVHDTFRLKGKEYRVTDVYPDSGFLMARLNEEPNYYVDLVIKTQGERNYDETQLRWVTTTRDYNVTAYLTSDHDYLTWTSDSDDTLNLSIDERHIGFRPKAGMEVVWEKRVRTIRHVHYYRGERQYKLRCR